MNQIHMQRESETDVYLQQTRGPTRSDMQATDSWRSYMTLVNTAVLSSRDITHASITQDGWDVMVVVCTDDSKFKRRTWHIGHTHLTNQRDTCCG